jgi:hypothetical protein
MMPRSKKVHKRHRQVSILRPYGHFADPLPTRLAYASGSASTHASSPFQMKYTFTGFGTLELKP